MAHDKTHFENRIIDFIRKSDDKLYPAEVRQVPSRFSTDITQESITVVYIDAEDGFASKEAVLNYKTDTEAPWDWENDTFTCTYVIPEVVVKVQQQTPRSVSPILEKGTKMTVTSSK